MLYQLTEEDEVFAREVISFFTSSITNKGKFEEIKQICLGDKSEMNTGGRVADLEQGHYTMKDFSYYYFRKKLGDGYSMEFLRKILQTLAENDILSRVISLKKVEPFFLERYCCLDEVVRILFNRDVIINLIMGWEFISKKYSNSVFMVEHINENGDRHLGTGFYIKHDDKALIVTNKHVVEGAKDINLFSVEFKKVGYSRIIIDKELDLAYLELQQPLLVPDFTLSVRYSILSEVITIGYPIVPRTNNAYQVHHKGEINSFVQNYDRQKLFIISSKSSPGNSGSPVIDSLGTVVGVLTEQLFEQEQFERKGVLPYAAAIPASEVVGSVNLMFDDRSI